MGNKPSQEDQVHLLDDDEEIKPVFDELKLVLIGSHDVGKNFIGNAIFKKKVFTFWKVRKHVSIVESHTVSGRRIHLTRTPGWKENWNSPEKTKSKIVHCVHSLYDTEPHAVLLALKVNSVLSERTIETLENFLTVQLWDHTIVLFTHGDRLNGSTIEKHIRHQRLKPLIEKCGNRYFVIQKNNINQITEKIEELIIRKNSASCFKPNDQIKVAKLLSDWKHLVERIKFKIASILTFKQKLDLARNNDSIKELLHSKDVEINRLKSLIEEKDKKIKRLQSISSYQEDHDLLSLLSRISELEEQLYTISNELKGKDVENETLKKQVKKKDAEIEELKKELRMWQEKAMDARRHEDQYAHASYCSKLAQDVKTEKNKTDRSRTQTKIQLNDLPSNGGDHIEPGSVLHNWGVTLLNILEDLSKDHLKKFKDLMHFRQEWKIPRRSMEDKSTGDLVDLIIEKWGERQSVLKTRDLIKTIPRNDDRMRKLFIPFLKEIGETWGP